MRIAVNVQKLVKNKMEGLGWFVYETMSRIVKSHPEHEFTFIFGKGIEQEFIFDDNVKCINIGPPFFKPLAWLLKFEFLLPQFINKNKFDLFISPDGWSSTRIKTKKVIVIHDINFAHYPEFLQKSFYYYYSFFFPRWAKSADRIATVSSYSMQDIVNTYKIDSGKIDVLYNAASPVFKPVTIDKITKIRNRYAGGNSYFLFVGALHPRKNIVNLFKAFDKFKNTDNRNVKLLIVGEKFYWDKKTDKVYNGLKYKTDIVFTGRLSQEELKNVMASALALTYVSFFEGFGIPIVEAMSCEVPVITSNTTSMPEVAGDAALTVNPYSVDDIAGAMQKIAADDNLRKQLIEAGNKRKQIFSWDKTAEKLWQTVEHVVC
jgi:glycosyltransferase involved in cell wall biosynthesis